MAFCTWAQQMVAWRCAWGTTSTRNWLKGTESAVVAGHSGSIATGVGVVVGVTEISSTAVVVTWWSADQAEAEQLFGSLQARSLTTYSVPA